MSQPQMTQASPAPGQAVLVVEDEVLVRMLVVQTLEDAGYTVHEAGEARGAMEVLAAHGSIDLVVTDVGLPGVNGRQLAQQARDRNPGLKILFMTGYNDGPLTETALPPGVDLITKPFNLDSLTAKAEALLALS